MLAIVDHLRRLRCCERGNIMILTALMAMPLLIVVAGVIDSNRATALHQRLQTAADAAVIAAFHQRAVSFDQRQRFAVQHFLANLGPGEADDVIQARLDIDRTPSSVTLTFSARAKFDGMLGGSMPFSTEQISVGSHAELQRRWGARPRLVGGVSTKSQAPFDR